MTPLERAARALHDRSFSGSIWEDVPAAWRERYLINARAVIEAIRESDDLMADRADQILLGRDPENLPDPSEIWEVMIDALLEEGR